MTQPQEMTIGAFLAGAERSLASRGGFRAIVTCDTRKVQLIRARPDGTETCVAQSDLPQGCAPEDAAMDLLAEYPDATPAERRFAAEIYFPITIR